MVTSMTIKIPEKDSLDKLLALMGKRRAVHVPRNLYEKYGPYVYAQAKKESFWHALIRPKNENLPEGWIYSDDIFPEGNSHA